jgi:hypothetical protein
LVAALHIQDADNQAAKAAMTPAPLHDADDDVITSLNNPSVLATAITDHHVTMSWPQPPLQPDTLRKLMHVDGACMDRCRTVIITSST